MSDAVSGTVCFAHGMESGPWGTKITALAEVARQRRWQVQSPDFRFTKNPQERVRWLLDHPPAGPRPLILVGSSMGAYVMAQVSSHFHPDALFLMAPALYFPNWDEDPADCPLDTVVIHGWRDDVVPVDVAWRFAQPRRAALHLLNSSHDLNDQLDTLTRLFATMLDRHNTARSTS